MHFILIRQILFLGRPPPSASRAIPVFKRMNVKIYERIRYNLLKYKCY